jgi:hypothetical protein
VRRAAVAIAVIAALLGGPALAQGWKPEPEPVPTAQEALEALDRALLPVLGRMEATFADLAREQDEVAIAALVSLVQRTAARGYGVVMAAPHHECSADYAAVLRTGYLLLGDSVDSFRAQDTVYRAQLDAASYLLGPYATLVRDATDCGGGTVTLAPKPTATPRPMPSPEPSA